MFKYVRKVKCVQKTLEEVGLEICLMDCDLFFFS